MSLYLMLVTFHKVSQQILFLSTLQMHAFVIFANHLLTYSFIIRMIKHSAKTIGSFNKEYFLSKGMGLEDNDQKNKMNYLSVQAEKRCFHL